MRAMNETAGCFVAGRQAGGARSLGHWGEWPVTRPRAHTTFRPRSNRSHINETRRGFAAGARGRGSASTVMSPCNRTYDGNRLDQCMRMRLAADKRV